MVTGSHDKSLRRWQRTDEPFFIDEEKEKRLESLFEGAAREERREAPLEGVQAEGVVESSAHKTQVCPHCAVSALTANGFVGPSCVDMSKR